MDPIRPSPSTDARSAGRAAANDLLATLARRVRSLRQAHGLTLREIARRSGLSLRYLMEVEAGRGNISVRRLGHLAAALRTTPADLISTGAIVDRPALIALLGLRGAGKTTVGRRLARRLRVPFVELDRRVETRAGLALDEIFRLHGEAYYRRLEHDALRDLVADAQPMVVAVGGGLVTSPETYALLRREATTIWLKARPEDYWARVLRQGDRRPMREHPQAGRALRRLADERGPLYAQATFTVDTSALTATAVVRAIETRLRGSAS